jgi:methionyl-tRNA formyltransferase
MKQAIFVGNRLNVVNELINISEINVKKIYVQKDSLLHRSIDKFNIPYRVFEVKKKFKLDIISDLKEMKFDLLISNGCPFILPIEDLKISHPDSLFINTHPTYLPHLRGKTPLNGVFMLDYKFIGATTHYMDSGIDTGTIIYQEKVDLTPDIDQGLVYYISFNLESIVFRKALKILINHDFKYEGTKQVGQGSYFNRNESLFRVDFSCDSNEEIIKKINSIGMINMCNQIKIGEEKINVLEAESIINPFLLDRFNNAKEGTLLYRYNNKILVKSKDGIIKMTIIW